MRINRRINIHASKSDVFTSVFLGCGKERAGIHTSVMHLHICRLQGLRERVYVHTVSHVWERNRSLLYPVTEHTHVCSV